MGGWGRAGLAFLMLPQGRAAGAQADVGAALSIHLPPKHTGLSSPCFNLQSLGGGSGAGRTCTAGTRGGSRTAATSRGGKRGLGVAIPCHRRPMGQRGGGHIHLSCLGCFLLMEGPGPPSCPQKHGLSERPSPHTTASLLPHDGLEEAGRDAGTGGRLSQSRQQEGPAEPPATSHAMGSPPHISPVVPPPHQRGGPHQCWEGFFLPPGMSSALGTAGPCPSDGGAHW